MEKETRIGISTQEFLDPTTPYAVLLPLEWYSKIAKMAGVSGVEVLPTKIIDMQIRSGLVSNEGLNSATSGHQSFRGNYGLMEAYRKFQNPKQKLIAMSSVFALPTEDSSLATLKRLQEITKRKLPVVAYPSSTDSAAVLFSQEQPSPLLNAIENRIFQPSAEHIKLWGKIKPEKIKRYLDNHGWSGFCLDLLHVREKNKKLKTTHWDEYLPQLLPFTKEVHIAAGRLDSIQTEIDTMAELADLYTGSGNTEITKMLEVIRKSGWKGLVITETPAIALKSVAGYKNPILSPSQVVKAHTKISSTVKSILE